MAHKTPNSGKARHKPAKNNGYAKSTRSDEGGASGSVAGKRRRTTKRDQTRRARGSEAATGPGYKPKPGNREPRSRKPRRTFAPPAGLDNGFVQIGVPAILAGQLAADGITEPFPIQTATIPDALAGRDILGRGQTGSGKTLAFGLPLITQLAMRRPGGIEGGAVVPSGSTAKHPKQRHGQAQRQQRNAGLPRGLVLVPTRELAMQVHDTLEPLAAAVGLRLGLVIGGASYDRQIRQLSRGIDILVATPGRLEDLLNRDAADLHEVRLVVLDEADQMADMGFLPQVDALMERVPNKGQRLLFSATLDRGVGNLVAKHLSDPVEHSTDPQTASVESMTHRLVIVSNANKSQIAAQVAQSGQRSIVYVRTRALVDEIAEAFTESGLRVNSLHGGMSQRARSRAMDGFRQGRVAVLVATDVAARGIHVDDVDLVVQMDPPRDHTDYVHRAGRTARAGRTGTVVTLTTHRQRRQVERVLRAAGVTAEVDDQDPRGAAGAARSRRPSGSRSPRNSRSRPGAPRTGKPAYRGKAAAKAS